MKPPAVSWVSSSSGSTAVRSGVSVMPPILRVAVHRPDLTGAEAVLIADTDTRNPNPAVYTALLERVQAGAAFAIAVRRPPSEVSR